jgi:hypothetical protein
MSSNETVGTRAARSASTSATAAFSSALSGSLSSGAALEKKHEWIVRQGVDEPERSG